MLSSCGAREDSWESLGLQDQTSQSQRKSTLNIHWKDWCWSWSSNTLATSCKELIHWKRPWCWEKLKAREGGDRGWDGRMASLTQWIWVWANFKRQWRTRKPGMLQSMGSQRVGHDLVTEQQQSILLLTLLIIMKKKKKQWYLIDLNYWKSILGPASGEVLSKTSTCFLIVFHIVLILTMRDARFLALI